MSNITNVDLSFHCPMEWSQMTPVPGGRFCDSCKFVVHDFTNSSKAVLEEAMRKNPGRVCGRFRSNQMSTGFLQRAAIAAFATAALGACTQQDAADPAPGRPILEMEKEVITMGVVISPSYAIPSEFQHEVELDSLRYETEKD